MEFKECTDEYQEIYERFDGSGFEFVYNPKNRYLGASRSIYKDSVKLIDPICRNNDDIPLFVNCKDCNEYMEFQEGPKDELDGWWVCPQCDSRLKEITVYNRLERENAKFIADLETE